MQVREGHVEVEGLRLAYLAVNEHLATDDEPAIVSIRGVLASVNFWRDCVPSDFKESRAWYALSLPAHHPSTVPGNFALGHVNAEWFFHIMNGALTALLADKKAIIVGHSTGGFSALNLAINHAPNVIGIVSVAGFHKGTWNGAEGKLLKLAGLGKWAKNLFALNIRISQVSRFGRRTFAGLLAYDRRAYRANPLSQRMLEKIETDTCQQDPAALFVLFNGISTTEIADQLAEINIPCHIFSGSHDPVVPTAQTQVLTRKVPNAQSVIFQNVGHMPFIEDTDAYFDALQHALSDIAEKRAHSCDPEDR